jgi:hypothetical protein
MLTWKLKGKEKRRKKKKRTLCKIFNNYERKFLRE